MSRPQQSPLTSLAEPEAGFIRRTLRRLDAWFTAQLEASDPVWSSDPKVSEYGTIDQEKTAP